MRRLLVSVDNSDVCEEAVKWVMANLYQEGDEVHLLHVIPRLQMQTALYGAPPVDFLPYQVRLTWLVYQWHSTLNSTR